MQSVTSNAVAQALTPTIIVGSADGSANFLDSNGNYVWVKDYSLAIAYSTSEYRGLLMTPYKDNNSTPEQTYWSVFNTATGN